MSAVEKDVAGRKLVDRLIDLLGDGVAERTTTPYNKNNDAEPPKGISLPATAITWMATHKLSTTDKWTLLLALLHHVKSLRVTLEPWPPNGTQEEATTLLSFLSNLSDQPVVDLDLFPKLQILWLDRIPLEWLIGASTLRESLQVLRITQSCIYNLRILLYDNDHPVFPNLTHLKLSSCALHDGSGLKSRRRFDQPLPTVASISQVLRSLDLSDNDLYTESAAMSGVRHLRHLQKLDVSHNRLTNLPTIHQRLHCIRILNLSYNYLSCIQGIGQLTSLVTLRLAHNRLTDLEQTINLLAGIKDLHQLSLEGNPFQFDETGTKIRQNYRLDVLNAFRERRFATLGASDFATMNLRSVQQLLPVLDGKPASLAEIKALRSRTFVPIRLIPAAVQLSARQSRRVVAAIAENVNITGYQTRSMDTVKECSKVPFTSVDVVKYLASVETEDDNDTDGSIKRVQADIVVPENVLVETHTDHEREAWESAFHDNLGVRYITEANPPAIVKKQSVEVRTGATLQTVAETHDSAEKESLLSNHSVDATHQSDLLSQRREEEDGDLTNLSLSFVKPDEDDMKASGTTTVTTAESTQPALPRTFTPERFGGLNPGIIDHSASSVTPQGARLPLQVTPFSDRHWQDDAMSLPSSLGTPYKGDCGLTKWEIFRLAETNSKFEGSYMYQKLLIHNHLELYFEHFVFAEPKQASSEIWYDTLCQYPKIGVWPVDRKRRDEASNSQQFTLNSDEREVLRRVWKETIVPCGKNALRRLTPKRSERYGFHGELLWTSSGAESMRPDIAVDARQTICCNTDKSFYVIIDHDTAIPSPKAKRKTFPRPIPKKAVFRSAMWPHAMACHAFESLERITIGFSFQRLTLQFRHQPSDEVFVYVLLTANKISTVELLKEFQELANGARASNYHAASTAVEIDNDDPIVLDAVARAIVPNALGVILHYQVVRQRWKHGDRGLVRRVCVLTDCNIYLMDEDYGGDGSSELIPSSLGDPSNRFVDGAELGQVVEVQAAGDDPTAITIVLRLAALSKPHNWRLVCRTKEGAERLVDDVRKATRSRGQLVR